MEEKKILIVDDDAVVLRTMKDGLGEGYKIYGANSGPNALKVMKKVKPELVLLDYEMPQMNGPAVLKAIREDEEIASTPVLFLTGVSEDQLDTGGLTFSGFVRKSLPMDEIRGIIAGVI